MNIKLYAIKTIRSTKKSKDTFLKILRNYIYIYSDTQMKIKIWNMAYLLHTTEVL